MKSIGVVRKIDQLGRLVIPKEIRKVLDMPVGTSIEFYTEGDTVVLKKYQPDCLFCSNGDDLIIYKGKHVCASCMKELGEMNE